MTWWRTLTLADLARCVGAVILMALLWFGFAGLLLRLLFQLIGG